MEIISTNTPNPTPALIKGLHDVIRKRAFLQINQVFLQLRCTACSDDDRIAEFSLQQRVIRHPSQCTLGFSEVVFFGYLYMCVRKKGSLKSAPRPVLLYQNRMEQEGLGEA